MSQLNRLDPYGRRIAYLQCPGCGVIVSAQNRPVGDRGWCSPGCQRRHVPVMETVPLSADELARAEFLLETDEQISRSAL